MIISIVQCSQHLFHFFFREVNRENMAGLQVVQLVFGLEAFFSSSRDVEHDHVVGFDDALGDSLLQRGGGYSGGMIDVDAFGLLK